MRLTHLCIALVSVVIIAACGEPSTMGGTGGGSGGGSGGGGGGGSSKLDAGVKKDAGVTAQADAGREEEAADSGSGQTHDDDAGVPGGDAGSVSVDAGSVSVDAGQTAGDAGVTQPGPDAGSTPTDAGSGGVDAGTSATDAGVPLSWVALVGPRRGPIELRFTFDASAGFTAFTLSVDKGVGFVAATVMSVERTATEVTFVWDSFADLSSDVMASLKVTGTRPAGEVAVPFTLDVRNDLDPIRLLSVAQPKVTTPGGGQTGTGNGVSLIQWGATDGGVKTKRFSTVAGVWEVVAAPHGRSTAVLGSDDLVLIKTPLDGDPANASLSASLTLPGSPTSIRWSRDGRFIYALIGVSAGRAPSLELCRVSEDQSTIEAPVTIASFDRPPMAFDLDEVNGRIVVALGTGMSASTGLLAMISTDGGSLTMPLDRDWGVQHNVSVSPRGDLAIVTSTSSDELFVVPLGMSSFGSVTVRTDVSSPGNVVFDPRSDTMTRRFAVTSIFVDRVTPMVVNGSTVTKGSAITSALLPEHLDVVERGTRIGTVVGDALSTLFEFSMALDGGAQSFKFIHEFDGGTTEEPAGIAIQR